MFKNIVRILNDRLWKWLLGFNSSYYTFLLNYQHAKIFLNINIFQMIYLKLVEMFQTICIFIF